MRYRFGLPGPQRVVIARLTPGSTTVIALEDIVNAAGLPSISSSPGSTTHSASTPAPTVPCILESSYATAFVAELASFYCKPDSTFDPVNESDSDYPRLPEDFGTPPPSPTESEFDWPTRSNINELADSALTNIDMDVDTVARAAEETAEVASLNAIAEAAATDAAEALKNALAGWRGNFDNFLALVETAVVSDGNATALKAIAEAARQGFAA